VVAIGVVAAACSSGERTPLSLGAQLDCASTIDMLTELPIDYRELAAVVALPEIDSHQLGRSGPDGDPNSARKFAKMGLLIRRGTAFELHVGGRSQGNALIAWGNIENPGPVSSIAVDDCPGRAEWLVYAGGVWVLEPACVALIVIAGDETVEMELPIGQTCS
jgi:hypothetical protein